MSDWLSHLDRPGTTRLQVVFWLYGVLASHIAFGLILIAYAHVSSAALALLLIAFMVYTSGTTGEPKAAMNTHRNVVRLFAESSRRFRFDHTDTWTLFHTCTFDFSVWEIWGALLHGGRLHQCPRHRPGRCYRA